MSLPPQSSRVTVTVRYFDDGTREVVAREDITVIEGSTVPDGGNSDAILAIGCFVKIGGRGAVVIPNAASLSAHAIPVPSTTSPPSGSAACRKRPRGPGLNIG